MTDRVGQQLGHYRLLRLIGQGGFADVYLGEHIHLHTHAAIKVLQMRLVDSNMEQFRNEAQIVASLIHPNIIRVLDFGVEDGIPFLVMDYASNGTLRQRHPKGIPLPLTTIIPYVRQVASALQYAHDRKLIHRDVKPENILLGSNNMVLLSDFGLALFARTTELLSTQKGAGTALYISPEQLQGKPTFASDQYSLAVVAYEWLCGKRPFEGDIWALFHQHMYVAPPPLRQTCPDVPAAVEEVILRALAKEPQQRFPSVTDFAIALKKACQPPSQPQADASSNSFSSQQGADVLPAQPETAKSSSQSVSQSLPPVSSQPDAQSALLHPPIEPVKGSTSLNTGFPAQASDFQRVPPVPNLASKATNTGRRGGLTWRKAALVGLAIIVVVASVELFFPTLTHLIAPVKTYRTVTPTTHPVITATAIVPPTSPPYIPMFGFNLQRTHFNPDEHTLAPTNVSKLVQDWIATTGNGIYSSPAVANGIVYVGSDDGYLYAFKVSNGKRLWRAPTRGEVRSSPAIANGVVYVGSFDGNLYAFDAATGKPIWTTSTRNIIRSSPAIANGTVYVGSQDGNLYAFKASGCSKSPCKPLWTASTGRTIYYSSPAIVNGIVYIGLEDYHLYAFQASNGRPIWRAATGGPIDSSPAVANEMVYITSEEGMLYAFDASHGKLMWETSTGERSSCQPAGDFNRSSPAVAYGTVYVGSGGGNLYAINALTGKVLWTALTGKCVRSSPAVANGVVYVGSDDHNLYAFKASGCNNPPCLALKVLPTRGLIFSSPAVVNGVVYVGSEDGNLYAFHLPGIMP